MPEIISAPAYRRAERTADACVHFLGIAASLAAMPLLVILGLRHLPGAPAGGLAVYAASAVAMFIASAAYNLIDRPRWNTILIYCDQSAIFLMIAGTYTPLALIMLGGAWGAALLAAVWAIAVFGITLRLTAPRLFDRISLSLYMLQGWAVLAAIGPLSAAVSTRVMTLIVIGGVLYTTGIVFHLWRRLPYQNAIWHVFVLSAATVHYAAILETVTAGLRTA